MKSRSTARRARVLLFTRNGHNWTGRYPLIVEAALKNRQTSFVIDGEAVLLDVDGVSDFNELHSRRHDDEVQLYSSMIGKNSFHIVGQDRRGAIVLRQRGTAAACPFRRRAKIIRLRHRHGQQPCCCVSVVPPGLPDLWNRAARRGLPGRRQEIHDTVKQRLSHFAFGKPRLF